MPLPHYCRPTILLLCILSVIFTTSSATFEPSRTTTTTFVTPSSSTFAFARTPSHRTKTSVAAIMSSVDTFSNWRVVTPDGEDVQKDGVVCSPFCHPLSTTAPPASATATAAPWSEAAYQSALDLHQRIKDCTDPYISPMLTSALHDLDMAYRLYGPFCMVGSYNGGKDAVVIFHLMRAVHANYCREIQNQSDAKDDVMIPRPRVIYFQHPDEFPQVESLLHETVKSYDLEMLAFREGVSFGEGLKYLIERNYPPGKDGLSCYGSGTTSFLPPPHPLAFVLGTRKDDPNAGSQGIYAPSSHYMPPFLRVNPILNWTYGHVWHFLRVFELPYCSLYDDGYTSLGTVKDTLPCPALKKGSNDTIGGEEYWPAYMLKDWSQERAGRVSKKKQSTTETPQDEAGKVNGEQSTHHGATMSQTSSTVSLTKEEGTSMSDVVNVDDVEDAPATGETSKLPPAPSVALIVIGDELLKGMTPDSNVLAAAKALRAYNLTLTRVSIISDDLEVIVEEIHRVSTEVDVVITSGGVGPTHDDVTIKSVAAALGLEMELHFEMAKLLVEKMGGNGTQHDELVELVCNDDDPEALFSKLPDGIRKMATIPSTSLLQYLTEDPDGDEWPVLQCNNIFVLPGVPPFFQQKIQQIASHLSSPTTIAQISQTSLPYRQLTPPRSDTYRVLLSVEETTIVQELNASVASHPHVSFGSYPIVDHPKYKTIITLEGRFYNGAYTKRSERLLGRTFSDGVDNSTSLGERKQSAKDLFFTKEEMDNNVKLALEDLKTRLPKDIILKVDTNDYLNC